LAYAAREDDPAPLVAVIFQAHKRIGYDWKRAKKIMDGDNRDIAIFMVTQMLNTCSTIIIQGVDGKNIIPSVFKSMGIVVSFFRTRWSNILSRITKCHEPNTA
jgi:hypothetical protein